MDSKKIGLRIKKYRGDKSQEDLAKLVGVSQSTVAMWEIGERTPSDEAKIKLSDLFGVSVMDLFYC